MTLSRLPSAGREAAWVAERLGGDLLSDKSATETRIRSQIGQADIVHFATHGLAIGYWNKARNSFLAFAPDSTNDGILTVGELMNDPKLSLSARLVVLSACQTAMGAVFSAEGTLGLQRAFLARGATSLLVSLWSVDDEGFATRSDHAPLVHRQ